MLSSAVLVSAALDSAQQTDSRIGLTALKPHRNCSMVLLLRAVRMYELQLGPQLCGNHRAAYCAVGLTNV